MGASGAAQATFSAAPTALRVTRPDGRVWLQSPQGAAFLELGVATDGARASRFYDPRVEAPSGVVWEAPTAVVSRDGASVVLEAPRAGRVRVHLEPGARPGEFRLDVASDGADVVLLRVSLAADQGAYLGLGERFGPVDARGSVVPMQLHLDTRVSSGTNEHHVPVPFFLHTSGYGLFAETREAGAVDVGATDPSRVRMTFEGRALRLHCFTAEDPLEVARAYARTTGLPRLPPAWAQGPMHWRNAWRNRDEVLADARRLRAEGIPATTLWIDNPWQVSYNDHTLDPVRFRDPPGMLRELASLGYRVLVWSTPYLDAVAPGASPANEAERLFVQAREQGYFVRLPDGTPYVSPANFSSAGGMSGAYGAMVDFTHEGASRFWSARLDPLIALGVRAFKLDYGEDIIAEVAGVRPGFRFSTGETERGARWAYPQGYHRAYRAALDRAAGGDGFLLVRASSWGGQTVADVVWPGDLDNDFRRAAGGQVGGLPAAVNALQSLAVSGFANFGSDTGGYRGGRPSREALLRWAEHTALSPVMQLGGGGEDHNPWSYDPEAVRIYQRLARLHQDLVPYLRVQAVRASRDGTPPVLPLALAYPEDPRAREPSACYLLGPELLVCPVLEPGATTRAVHVPAGLWVRWHDGTAVSGPAELVEPTVLGRPVLYLRQGAIVPLAASDLATMVSAEDPSVIDGPDRRGLLRARVVPAGRREVVTEDEARIAVDEAPGALTLAFTPGRDAQELRAELLLAHRGSPSSGLVARVTADGAALPRVATAEEATAGCARCWYQDPATRALYLSARGAVTARVE